MEKFDAQEPPKNLFVTRMQDGSFSLTTYDASVLGSHNPNSSLQEYEEKPKTPEDLLSMLITRLHQPIGNLPVDVIKSLNETYKGMRLRPTEEMEQTLIRQAILLQGVQSAYLLKAANTRNTNTEMEYSNLALKAGKALVEVLGAIRVINKDKEEREAIPYED